MFMTIKKAKELAKIEYLKGAAATAEAFKQKEEEAERQRKDLLMEAQAYKTRIMEDWATLQLAKKELENDKALIFLTILKDIFGKQH